MVMITRSAQRKACSSCYTSTNSEQSQKSVPPWCSSGKVQQRKAREVQSSSWDTQTYPFRENIWDYLHGGDKSRNFHARITNKRTCKQKSVKNRRLKYIPLVFLSGALVVFGYLWLTKEIPRMQTITKLISHKTSQFTELLYPELSTSVSEECCQRMSYLAAKLLRIELALRNTQRVRRTMLLAQTIKTEPELRSQTEYIEGVQAIKGVNTEELGSWLGMWNLARLWRTSVLPRTVVSLRSPVPADCWSFSGSQGELILQLPHKQTIHSMSIEHVRPDTCGSSPRHFILYSNLENGTRIKQVEDVYKSRGPAEQHYAVRYRKTPVERLVLKVLSNHGNPRYTCIYRVRLYKHSL